MAAVAVMLQPVTLSRADDDPSLDTDGDGIPDIWESQHGLNPNDPTDAFKDRDGDRIPSLWEYLRSTDPAIAESVPAPDAVVDGAQATDASLGRYATLQEAYNALPVLESDGVTPHYGFIQVKAGTYTAGVDGTQTPKKVLWLADVGGQVVIQNAGPAMVIADEAVVDGLTIRGDSQTPGVGLILQPPTGLTVPPEVRVVNTIIAGRTGSADPGTVGGVLNNGAELWLVQDTLVGNIGTGADAVLNQTGSVHLVNSVIGAQGSSNAALSVVDQSSEGGVTSLNSIITGMQGAWGSSDADPQLTASGGHLTAASAVCLAQGGGGCRGCGGPLRPDPAPRQCRRSRLGCRTVGGHLGLWYSRLV